MLFSFPREYLLNILLLFTEIDLRTPKAIYEQK
jgi:hypothetical protein